MKVNMTPNPLDVVTIHASQGDTEARQWEFELHNNGELIDTSEITEQLFFKAYKGGTEQILPENTSTPTTSPFKGDIRYPQGLLADQEFTYRQSPTEEDGLAKITDIKGNTIVWNQIFKPQYRSQSGIQSNEIHDGNDYSVRIFGTATANAWLRMDATGTLPVGHKFLLDKGSTSNLFDINNDNNGLNVDFSAKTKIGTVTTANKYIYIHVQGGTTIDITVKPMLIDLTQMGLDSLTDAEILQWFADYFPLPYYAYNQGSLLSFNGTGIKTVGKNKFNLTRDINVTLSGVTFKSNADKSITVNGTATANATITQLNGFTVPNIKKGESLIWSGGLNRPVEQAYAQLVYNGDETGQTYSFVSVNNQSVLINATESMTLSGVYISCRSGNTFNNETFYPMLRYANTDSTFEPYTSSALSLPISTYFPTGMKSAGSVYDELTESKAITRMGAVDLGSLTWRLGVYNEMYTNIGDMKKGIANVKPNILCPKYPTIAFADRSQYSTTVITVVDDQNMIQIRNTGATDVDAFKQSLSGVYLYYELATETETSFTTASLVTENAEIPLSNEDGVLVGKCTEELSAEPGFIDAKIKLTDGDGTCYSNKIQLHVERKPS